MASARPRNVHCTSLAPSRLFGGRRVVLRRLTRGLRNSVGGLAARGLGASRSRPALGDVREDGSPAHRPGTTGGPGTCTALALSEGECQCVLGAQVNPQVDHAAEFVQVLRAARSGHPGCLVAAMRIVAFARVSMLRWGGRHGSGRSGISHTFALPRFG